MGVKGECELPGGCWEPNPRPLQKQRDSELLSHCSISKTASFYVTQADLKLSVSCLCLRSAAINRVHSHTWLLFFPDDS